MIAWVHQLPVGWMALVIFAVVALLVVAVFLVVMRVAAGRHGAALQVVSPGMLPPIGIVFALVVGFMAAGVWDDAGKAKDAVSSEASALRSVVLLSNSLPPATATPLRAAVRRHITQAVDVEWPAMRDQRASLAPIPVALARALAVAIAIKPQGAGQVTAQRGVVDALQQALDARRQRIIVSSSSINAVKWIGLGALALVMLIAIACVHSANRISAAIALGLFGAAVAVVVLMLASQDRPFTGQLGVKPDLLRQVSPPA